MSRKTNKTARVLSLITGGKENETATPENNTVAAGNNISADQVSEKNDLSVQEGSADKTATTDTKNAVTTAQTYSDDENFAPSKENSSDEKPSAKEETDVQENTQNRPPTIEIVNSDDNKVTDAKEEPPSGKFKQFMSDRILNNRQRQKANAPIVEILFNDHDPLSDMIRDQLQAEEAMTDAIKKGGNPMDEEKKNLSPEEEPVQPFVTHDASSGKVKIKTPDGSESDELDYKFVNVFEEIVRSKVLDAMQKFDVCTCDRCIVDVVALTVTNLPAKCIVADKDAIFPLLSYYSSKYATSVQTELVKACVRVKENPHHKL